MIILGIETSCDETAAAVVRDGTKLLSNVVASQIDIHAQYGGVVPEVAARSHIEVILPVVEKALEQAFLDTRHSTLDTRTSVQNPGSSFDPWSQIDGIAVTQGPGLLGSLLIGTLTAQALARLKNKPLYPINHVEAHTYANFLDTRHSKLDARTSVQGQESSFESPKFPLLSLIVSGGHTQLVVFRDHGDYEVLGRTHDDAAGEAFDKVAKIIGLPYPGGPSVGRAALQGNNKAFGFPKPKLSPPSLRGVNTTKQSRSPRYARDDNDRSLDFSFSGLKTAVLREAQKQVGGDFRMLSTEIPAKLSDRQRNDIAASFQKTVVDILVQRVLAAFERYQPKSVVIAGGVAANQALRDELTAKLPIQIHYAPMNLCTDNAAMIASLGYFRAQRHKPASTITPSPVLSM